MKLIVVRHGRTVGNDARITQGHLPGELNELGLEQAKKLAKEFEKEKIDYIYCSDLNRTKQTAEPIIKMHPEAEVIYTAQLREGNRGIQEGKSADHGRELVIKQNIPIHFYNWETGESMLDVQSRAVNFYNKMLHEHKGKTVMWVSHGMFITMFLIFLHNKQFTERGPHHPNNAAYSVIEVSDDNSHKILKENCVEHLKD